MRQYIVGTAGHIDHGKTALIRALTGIDADRLPEEKERGITIDLGFAHLLLPEAHIGFVDAPGHERFLHNMLSGIGGIGYLLLVISAVESVMAQTREHFDICRLLGIEQGAVVLAKIDLVDEETLFLAGEEARDLARGSFLEDAPLFPLSSRTGEGLEALKNHLAQVVPLPTSAARHQAARLNIDRVFQRKGFGTVVTGTLLSGVLRQDQEIEFLPGHLAGRIRNLQSYGQNCAEVCGGRRVAVNVHRLETDELRRGMVLVEKNSYEAAIHMDVRLDLLPYRFCSLKDRSRVHLHIGSEETIARVILLSQKELSPGSSAVARLRLERPVTAVHGDRFILRRFSPLAVLGGGTVLHPFPPKIRRGQKLPFSADTGFAEGNPLNKIGKELQWAGAAGRTPAELGKVFGYCSIFLRECLSTLQETRQAVWPIGSTERAIARAALEETKTKLLDLLTIHHRENPQAAGPTKEELCRRLFYASAAEAFSRALQELQESETISLSDNRVCLFGRRTNPDPRALELSGQMENYYRRRALQATRWEEVVRELPEEETRLQRCYRQLLQEGKLIRLNAEFTLHREALQLAVERTRARYPAGKSFGVPEFKDLLGLTRKTAIPLLEYFDRQRITRRLGDARILQEPAAT